MVVVDTLVNVVIKPVAFLNEVEHCKSIQPLYGTQQPCREVILLVQLAWILQLWLMELLTYGSCSCNALMALVWISGLLKRRSSWLHAEAAGSEGGGAAVSFPKGMGEAAVSGAAVVLGCSGCIRGLGNFLASGGPKSSPEFTQHLHGIQINGENNSSG